MNSDVLILTGSDVDRLLIGRERELIDIVRCAYVAHAKKKTSLPHSTFLRFPGDDKNRIIALPAYLGDGFDIAGIKWVSSFPDNPCNGLERASAVLVLNSTTTGRPEAILEGSIINAKRTAASAALAAQCLLDRKDLEYVGVIGCGLVNYETFSFLAAAIPSIRKLVVYDTIEERARQFKRVCLDIVEHVEVAKTLDTVFKTTRLISLATTAGSPHVFSASVFIPGSLILHISLRDLSPEVIRSSCNVVDDADHVARAQTSIHLAEQSAGNRDFIDCSIGEILIGAAIPNREGSRTTIYSPFGLGILDIAVGQYVWKRAHQLGVGTLMASFLPRSWADRVSSKASSSGTQQF